jgi:hypothetical protein
MSQTIEGRIVSSNLGEFSKERIVYGYLSIQLPNKNNIKVKIDSYTWYETLKIGDEVVIDLESLGTTNILVARKIQLKSSLDDPSEKATVTT